MLENTLLEVACFANIELTSQLRHNNVHTRLLACISEKLKELLFA